MMTTKWVSSRLAVILVGLAAAAVGCGDGRTPLVVYSTHGIELLQLAEATFEAANPEIDVRWLDMGSQDVLDRVRSERANPQADVWFGGPNYILQRAASESLLVAYRPTWAAHVLPRSRGPGDFYFAAYETPAVIMYNTDLLTAATAPQDWDDLLDPRWRGKVVIRDPLASGTMRSVFGLIVQNSLRSYGVPDSGYAWLRRLDAQTREYTLNPTMLYQRLIRQEGSVTMWALPDVLVDASHGDPLGYVLPASGSPVIQDAIALVRGGRNPEVGRRFIEWVGSIAGQVLAAREAFRLPARTDLPADSLPQWVIDVRDNMIVADVDWNQLAAEGPEWMEYWDRHIRGRSTGED